MTQTATFRLKCVVCQQIDTRPANECREQPICTQCGSPMTLERVTVKNTKRESA
jgi:rRNA maturation endonuclease Nob1